ncbi:minor tail protein, partial [Brevibacillus agri BAB-2500]
DTTRNALLLRDAFGFEINESVKGADTMMKQFGITSDQAFSLIAQGAQKGLDKSGDLLDTANEYSNQFKSLGFTATEMFDTLAAGSQNGAFNLDKVGDAVKEFNIRSKDGSKTTIQAFEMLGLNADKMMHT